MLIRPEKRNEIERRYLIFCWGGIPHDGVWRGVHLSSDIFSKSELSIQKSQESFENRRESE